MAKLTAPEGNPTDTTSLYDQGRVATRQEHALDVDEIRLLTQRYLEDARNFMQEEISPERSKAWKYYNGEVQQQVSGNRSKVVMTEVRDTVESTMPAMMRIFAGGDTVVAFKPRGDGDASMAKQITAYTNYVFHEENEGWQLLYEYIKTALVSKTGIFKPYWEERVDTTVTEYSGLTPEEFALLAGDEETSVRAYEQTEQGLIDCILARNTINPRITIEGLPPEELLIDRRAKNPDDARLIGQKTVMHVSDLVASGFDQEVVQSLAYSSDDYEEEEREQRADYQQDRKEDVDDDLVDVYDCYVRLDLYGTGKTQWVRVVLAGEQKRLLSYEEWDGQPYCIGSPYPTPFAVIGKSQADITMDIQEIQTALTRQTLDNAYNVNNPQKIAVDAQVNLDDLLDNRFNGVIRAKAPGMVETLQTPFIGDKALAVIDYIDKKKEFRTGISAESMGLDAEALQSSSAIGVNGILAAAQSKPEMVARCLAETGLKQLFKKLLTLAIQHQDKPKMIRVTGDQFVPMDPRAWHMNFDIVVNVGLGRGSQDEKLAVLGATAQKQEQVLLQLGPDNPLTDLSRLRNTYCEMLKISGFRDTEQFFKPEEQTQAETQQLSQNKPPNPEVMKAQADIQKQQQEMQLKQQKQQQEMQLRVWESQQKMQLAMQKMLMEAGMREREAQVKAEIEIEKSMREAGLEVFKTQAEVARKDAELAIEARMEKYKIDKDAQSGQGELETVN